MRPAARAAASQRTAAPVAVVLPRARAPEGADEAPVDELMRRPHAPPPLGLRAGLDVPPASAAGWRSNSSPPPYTAPTAAPAVIALDHAGSSDRCCSAGRPTMIRYIIYNMHQTAHAARAAAASAHIHDAERTHLSHHHTCCLRPRSPKLCHGRLCNMYMSPASQKGSILAVMTAPWPSLSPPLRCPG